MLENIDRVLERGERIELLVDKTARLNEQSVKFEKSSRTLKRSMHWRKWRNIGIVVGILLAIVFIICMVACGIKFDQCG